MSLSRQEKITRPVQSEFLLAETQSTQRAEKKKNLICLCDLCGFV